MRTSVLIGVLVASIWARQLRQIDKECSMRLAANEFGGSE
jgi:hypothetical protein